MQDTNDMISILTEAEDLISKDKIQEAIDILEEQLPNFDNEILFLNFLGRLYLLKDNPQTALKYINQSLEINFQIYGLYLHTNVQSEKSQLLDFHEDKI